MGGEEPRCALVITHSIDSVVRHVWLDLSCDNIRLPHHFNVVLEMPMRQQGVSRARKERNRHFPEVEECVVRVGTHGWLSIHLLFLGTFKTSMAR